MLKHVKTSVLLTLGLLLVLVFPTATWAHSKLESSTPAADAKITESVKEVNLSFNENIDENLSTLKVKNAQGEEVEVSEVKVNQNTMAGTLAGPLPSGSYTVEWKIVGGDGHPVDGTYAFEVDAPEGEAARRLLPTPKKRLRIQEVHRMKQRRMIQPQTMQIRRRIRISRRRIRRLMTHPKETGRPCGS